MARQIRKKGLEAGHVRQAAVIARRAGVPRRRHQGRRAVELLLHQTPTQDVIALQVRRPLKLGEDRKVRRLVTHR